MGGEDLDPLDPPPGSATVHRPGIGYGYRTNYGRVRTYFSFQCQMKKKEREICAFEMHFKKSFLLAF